MISVHSEARHVLWPRFPCCLIKVRLRLMGQTLPERQPYDTQSLLYILCPITKYELLNWKPISIVLSVRQHREWWSTFWFICVVDCTAMLLLRPATSWSPSESDPTDSQLIGNVVKMRVLDNHASRFPPRGQSSKGCGFLAFNSVLTETITAACWCRSVIKCGRSVD